MMLISFNFSCHTVLIAGWQYMGLEDLKDCPQKLVRSGNRVSIQKTYSSTWKQYLEFCDYCCTLYALYLPLKKVYFCMCHFFIYLHLASICSLHIVDGCTCISPLENTPRLKLALRSMEIFSIPVKQKLPISFNMLHQIYV